MLTEADRLDALQGNGAELVRYDGGEFWGLLVRNPVDQFGGAIEGYAMAVEARSSDVQAITNGTRLTHPEASGVVRRRSLEDGGFALLLLKE